MTGATSKDSGSPARPDPIRPDSMALFAHDLKTPINHIIGYSELLLEETEEAGLSGYLSDLQRIHAAGGELLAFLSENLSGDRGEGQSPSLDELHSGLGPPVASIVG